MKKAQKAAKLFFLAHPEATMADLCYWVKDGEGLASDLVAALWQGRIEARKIQKEA
jgi:hypothetical protein